MRNLRKLTAVVIAIALVLTSMTAAFAASTYEFEAQATVLKDLGIWTGDASGDLMLGKELTRAEGAVLVLKTVLGKTEADMKAADTAVLSTYDDAAKVPAWAEGWMALAVKEGVVKGSNNNLKAGDSLLGKDLASMFMNALGYADVNEYGKAVELLAAKADNDALAAVAAAITNDALTRDVASVVVFGSLTVKADGETKTLVEKLVGTDAAKKAIAEKAGLIAVASTLDVVSATATNLRELVVTFTKAPDATEAKKTSNYKIGSNNPEAVTLSDDGKTVTLRTSNANKMGNYGTVDLTILKAVGFDADKSVKSIAVKDTTVPTAVSVKATGPKNIKVTLSEPLDESVTAAEIAASLKIDAGLIAIDNSGVTLSGLELNIKTYSDLAETSHKIEFLVDKNLKDNAGYKLQGATLTFDYVKDTSALTVSVDSSNETSVTIKFNKAIDASTLVGNADVKFRHTYNTTTNQVDGTSVTNSGDDQKFTVSFGSTKPFPPGSTTVYIEGADKIKDNYGNKLSVTSFTVTTTADLTKPTATAEFVDATTVKVTYSEDVKDGVSDANGANNPANYTLKSGSDVISVNSAAFDGTSKKVVKLTTNTLNGGTYTLTIKNVTDLSVAANKIDEVTLTFTGTDKVAPTVKTTDSKFIATNKFKVVFSEAMDAASITDKAVYKVGIAALKDDDTVEAVDANKAAIITFKTVPTAPFVLHVARVKDVAGNWTESFDSTITVSSGTPDPVGMKEAQLVSKTGIKIVINDTIKDMIVGDFLYSTTAGVWVTPKAISVAIVDGVTSISLVTEDLGNTTTYAGLQVKTNTTVAAKNTFDNPVAISATNVNVDKCAPGKSTIVLASGSATNGTQLKTVTINYSENLYTPSVQDTDYTVAGYEVESVSASANQVVLTLKTVTYGSYVQGTTEVSVTQIGEIQDANRNTLGAQDAWTTK